MECEKYVEFKDEIYLLLLLFNVDMFYFVNISTKGTNYFSTIIIFFIYFNKKVIIN